MQIEVIYEYGDEMRIDMVHEVLFMYSDEEHEPLEMVEILKLDDELPEHMNEIDETLQ